VTTRLKPGSRLGSYEIHELLGRGGMSAVYKGHDSGLNRAVALKVLPREFLHDSSFADRFQREAEIWGKLDHSAIVPVYFAGIEDGQPYIAMKFIPGGSLADLLRGGALELERALGILAEVVGALDYAHSLGIVHRDVKPANVLLGESGNAYLSDFGIARAAAGTPTEASTLEVVGTPGYMAPEQARSLQVDYRADIYSLGCMAYEMLTGAAPFIGPTPVDVMMRHLTEVPVPPGKLASHLPTHVEGAILKAMAKEPDRRWPTAAFFLQALLGRIDAEGVQTISLPGYPPPKAETVPAGPVPMAQTPRRRARLVVPILLGIALGLALVATSRWYAVPRLAGVSTSGGPSALLHAVSRAMDDGDYPAALRMAELALRLYPSDEAVRPLPARVRRAWEAEKAVGVWEAAPVPIPARPGLP